MVLICDWLINVYYNLQKSLTTQAYTEIYAAFMLSANFCKCKQILPPPIF